MGFWSSLGKIGLAAAPYVAAPFTGGASLYAAPMTSKALQTWNQSDANKRAAQGLGPSSFDKFLGMGSDIAGAASQFGAFNKLGGNTSLQLPGFGGGSSQMPQGWQGPLQQPSGWQNTLTNVLGGVSNSMGRSQSPFGAQLPQQQPSLGNNQGLPPFAMNMTTPQRGDPRLERQMLRGLGPTMGASNQNTPNLAMSIGQGRLEAIKNQPFRKGYDINYLGNDDETIINAKTPPIYAGRTPKRKKQDTREQPEA